MINYRLTINECSVFKKIEGFNDLKFDNNASRIANSQQLKIELKALKRKAEEKILFPMNHNILIL